MKTQIQKIRLGLFMDEDLHEYYEQECKKFNRETGLDITVNMYMLKVLKENRK